VRDLQRVIGDEAARRCSSARAACPPRDRLRRRRLERDRHVRPVRRRRGVELVGVEAAGEGIAAGRHGAPLTVGGRGGVLHGAYSAIMQDEDGQILEAHSISPASTIPAPARARLAARHRPRALRGVTDARRSPPSAARRARGHHPGARVRARDRLGARQRRRRRR
jgi:tryptophan synthase beta chain